MAVELKVGQKIKLTNPLLKGGEFIGVVSRVTKTLAEVDFFAFGDEHQAIISMKKSCDKSNLIATIFFSESQNKFSLIEESENI